MRFDGLPLTKYREGMNEITFQVEISDGWFVASWNDPVGGGITTQGKDLGDLEEQVAEAVRCHFDTAGLPEHALASMPLRYALTAVASDSPSRSSKAESSRSGTLRTYRTDRP